MYTVKIKWLKQQKIGSFNIQLLHDTERVYVCFMKVSQ